MSASERIPLPVVAGSAALALATAASVAMALPFDLPVEPTTVGYPVFYRYPAQAQVRTYLVLGALLPVLAAGTMLFWRRLAPPWRQAAAAAWAGFLPLPILLPPIGAGTRLERGLLAALLGVAGLTLVGRLLRAPRAAALGFALATAAALLPLGWAYRVSLQDRGVRVGGFDPPWLRPLLGLVVLAAGLALLRAWRRAGEAFSPRRARLAFLWLGLPLLALAAGFHYRVHSTPIDGLHEGEPLASAAALDAGRKPYRDVVFFHGLGEDPGRARLAFRWIDRSLRGLRLLSDLLVPVDLALFVLLGVAVLPGRWALLFGLLALCGTLPAAPASRSLFSDLALLALLLALSRPRPWRLGAAGVLAALSALWGLDTGLGVLVAGAAALAILAALTPDLRRPALAYAAGAAAVLTLFFGWLGVRGLLSDFAGLTRMVAADFGLAFARPYEFRFDSWPNALTSAVAPAVLLWGAVELVVRLLRGERGRELRLLLVLWLAAFVGFERGLDRHDLAHLGTAARLVWPLLFLLLARIPRAGSALAAALAVLVVLPGTALPRLWTLLRDFRAKQEVDITGRTLLDRPRFGVLLPQAEARRWAGVLGYIDALAPDRTFYDFSNNGVLYFLADRPLPTRFTQVWLGPGPQAQREIAARLAAAPPPLVVFRSGDGLDSLDHIDNRLRHWIVAEQLVAGYRPLALAHGFLLLAPGREPVTPLPRTGVWDVLNLGGVPLLWGAGGAGEEGARAPASPLAGGYRLEAPAGLRPAALALRTSTRGEGRAALTWRGPGEDSRAGLRFEVVGGTRRYLVPLSILPAWVWPAELLDIELRGEGGALEGVEARWIPGPLAAMPRAAPAAP